MAVERGQVQAKEFTKNGKPKLKIGGQWYFATRIDVSKIEQGQSIEFEWSEFGDPNERTGKRPRGINNFAPLPAGTPIPQANGHDHTSSEPMSEPKRMFVSNVASAALHGSAASTEDIHRVIRDVAEAYDALATIKQAAARQSAPQQANGHLPKDYDEGMPPYDDIPPAEPMRGSRTW